MKTRPLAVAIAVLFAALASAGPAAAAPRDDVAKKYAPVFFEEVRDKRDL